MACGETFWIIGYSITRHETTGSVSLGYRKFKAVFGTTSNVCVALWKILSAVRPKKASHEDLLWIFLHLKQYCIEHVNASLVGATEKKILQVVSCLYKSFSQ